MGLEFLRSHGANRVRSEVPQPDMVGDVEEEADEKINHHYEVEAESWQPRNATPLSVNNWQYRPRRFIDGKDVGRTVAWLRSPVEGYPVPVRLSEIGAVEVRDVDRELRREWASVERVVTFMVDLFPWDEIESFAIALQQNGFHLLPCGPPGVGLNSKGGYSYDFQEMWKTTANFSMQAMTRWETQALARANTIPTLVDGRLEPRVGGFDKATSPVVGFIKTHHENYLHRRGWQVFYDLLPGQRTPAFLLAKGKLDVVTWYVRLDGAHGEMPNTGVVRMEIPRAFFETAVGGDFSHLDRLSRIACDYRCRDANYGRAAISIQPVQRAEELLGALFTPRETLISRFYRMTSL